MEIFFPAFQKKYFHFIHDADGEGLIGSGFSFDLYDWIKTHNTKTVIGSLILVNVNNYMDEYNAPVCYK